MAHSPTHLPLALWKANLDLQLRIGQLIQDSSREWLEIGTRAAGEGAVEFDAEAQSLWRGGDWQALAALPVETFWRQLEQRLGDGQALGQLAINVQDNFASGLLSALQDWQAQVADAAAGTAVGGPISADDWSALFSSWGDWLAPPPASPAARDPAPPPAKQAASRKPAKPRPAAKGSRKRGG